MKDRIPVNPGRVLITPENGAAAYYATMTRADNPTQEGTPLNKNSLLKDATAALFGLGTDAVPDDVLAAIKTAIDSANANADTKAKIVVGSYTGDGRGGSPSSQWLSLTLPFVPKFVLIWESAGILTFTFYKYGDAYFYTITPGTDNYPRQNVVTVSGSTMTWWTQQTSGGGLPTNQLNVASHIYNYVAIG